MFIRKNSTKHKVYLNLKLQRKSSEERFCCYKTTAGKLPKQCKAGSFLRGHIDSQKASVRLSPTEARARAVCSSDSMCLRGTRHPACRQPVLYSGLLWPPLNKYWPLLSPFLLLSSCLLSGTEKCSPSPDLKALWWSGVWNARGTPQPLLQEGRSCWMALTVKLSSLAQGRYKPTTAKVENPEVPRILCSHLLGI